MSKNLILTFLATFVLFACKKDALNEQRNLDKASLLSERSSPPPPPIESGLNYQFSPNHNYFLDEETVLILLEAVYDPITAHNYHHILFHTDAATPELLHEVEDALHFLIGYPPIMTDPGICQLRNTGGVYIPPSIAAGNPNSPPPPDLIFCSPRNINQYEIGVGFNFLYSGGFNNSPRVVIVDECNNNFQFTVSWTNEEVIAALILSGFTQVEAEKFLFDIRTGELTPRQLWDTFQLNIVTKLPGYINYINAHPGNSEVGCTYLVQLGTYNYANIPGYGLAYNFIDGKGLLGCGG